MNEHRTRDYRQMSREYLSFRFAFRGAAPSFKSWMCARDRVALADSRPLPLILLR